jgi:pyruvate/2-oxoglutarate dehydrogenase complex dihydrolipoamide dehydrogenase (E3) component
MYNPLTGREAEIKIAPVEQPRHIMVVGAGPAGLEAAIIAAQRGHRVTLHERGNHLGGQLFLASRAPHKEEFLDVIGYLSVMVERIGVAVHLGTQVTPQMVLSAYPDAVIIATGAIPFTIPFPGLNDAHWMLASDLFEGIAQVETSTAFVIGGGLVGLEVADFLAGLGKRVMVVEMLPDVGADMDPLAKSMLLRRLNRQGVAIHTDTRVTSLTSNHALAQKADTAIRFPIETVIMAVGARPERDLADKLEDSGSELHIIGDAFQPRKALEAIWEGFEVGLKV